MRTPIKLLAAVSCLLASTACADDFHGFDPLKFDGNMLSAAALKAMVGDASKVTPPKTAADTASVLPISSETSLLRPCRKRHPTECGRGRRRTRRRRQSSRRADRARQCKSFAERKVDYVIEFQTDANFGQTVMDVFRQDGTKVTAIDIHDAGREFLRRQQSEVRLHGGILSGDGGCQAVRCR